MGLDFSNSDAHWSYSGFHRFRVKLAHVVGVDLEQMDGFTSGGNSWTEIKTPLKTLLNHSDCDGKLTAKQCAKISPALRQAVAMWPDDDFDKRQALLLADGMDDCAKSDTDLEFC